MEYNYVCIEGNIGSGKTTLAHHLTAALDGILVLEEFQENPFLPLFYQDASKYGFHVELSFLVDRFHQLKDLQKSNLFGKPTISDYYLIKCLLFARNNLSDNEYTLFHTFFEMVKNQTPTPDLIIYLDASVRKLQKNIEKRNRSYEQSITDEYLQNIASQYDTFLKSTDIPVLRINTDKYDFIKNSEVSDQIQEVIKNGMQNEINLG